MRFPWQRDVLLPEPLPTERVEVAVDEPTRETRQSCGDFSDAVVRLIEQTAAGSTADARSTAATESAAGALSRAFAATEVVGPPWVQQAVSPTFLGQVGRDLIRSGDSLHVIRVNPMGKAVLLPCSSWHFEGDADPDTWMVRATVFGPSSSQTWLLPYSSVIFVKWGSDPGTPYVGTAPSSYASTTNRMLTATQKTLADESGGPLANLLVSPQDGGDGDEDTDPLADLKRDIRNAAGAGLMVETTNAGWGEGKASAPQGDWTPRRYGPMPPAPLIELSEQAHGMMLAASGLPPDLATVSTAQGQREAFRRYLTMTVMPLSAMLVRELQDKLETDVSLSFNGLYAHDLIGRAAALKGMVAAGVPLDKALEESGLND